MVRVPPVVTTVAPPPSPPHDPVAALPPAGSAERWPWLQRLRRQAPLPLEPWLRALESGVLTPQPDLLAVLADHLDGPAMARLLRWWTRREPWDPALPALLVPRRDPLAREALRQACAAGADHDPARLVPLLPLLGHQRDPADFPLLRRLALAPGPTSLRQAALEGLCRGLGAWPRPALRHTLRTLTQDLHPPLAATAVDALARLPEGRPELLRLGQRERDPSVAARLARRLRGLPAARLVLIVHGRAGGQVPPELVALATTLEERRGAPVILEALTAAEPPPIPPSPSGLTTLVPLFLLPGGHVRRDLPARLGRWREAGPLWVRPFLGAWPAWQALLAEEVGRLAAAGEGNPPPLLHHPVEGPLPQRYLSHLACLCGTRCLPVDPTGASPEAAALPLALAASRLTDGREGELGRPLLARPAVRHGLLDLLEALP